MCAEALSVRQLAWRGPHTPGIDHNTALALSLLWVPGLGMFTGMPAWPVGEEKRFPEMANAQAGTGHMLDR